MGSGSTGHSDQRKESKRMCCFGSSFYEAVIVVVADDRKDLETCLHQLTAAVEHAQARHLHTYIFVVDNGSRDGVADLVDAYHESVYWTRNARRLGYAEARNQALTSTRRDGARFVMFVDPRAQIMPNLITDLIDLMCWQSDIGLAEPGYEILAEDSAPDPGPGGAAADEDDGEDAVSAGPAVPRGDAGAAMPARPEVVDRTGLRGVVYIVRRSMIHSIGLFDATHRSALALDDVCIRARHEGWRIGAAPALIVQYERPEPEPGGLVRGMCDTLYLTCCDPALKGKQLAKLGAMMVATSLMVAGMSRKPWDAVRGIAVFAAALVMLVGRAHRVASRRRSARRLIEYPQWRRSPRDADAPEAVAR
jgi:GT2 family glycosyltransferase